MSSIPKLAESLSCRNTIAPNNPDCQRTIANRLQAPGFDYNNMVEGPAP